MRKVTNIAGTAFANCTALKTITLETATPPTIANTTTFFKVTDVTVYVPKNAKSAYEAIPNWIHQIKNGVAILRLRFSFS